MFLAASSFEGLLFSHGLPRGASHRPLGRLGLLPSFPFTRFLTVPFCSPPPPPFPLKGCIFLLLLLFLFQRYNNECTPTDWNKIALNSLWFNSLTRNSCGQSVAPPPRWGLDNFCLTTPLTDGNRRLRSRGLLYFFSFCLRSGLFFHRDWNQAYVSAIDNLSYSVS